MARAGKRKSAGDSSRPSTFFIIALIVGFAILAWWFFHFLPKPAEQERKSALSTTVERVPA